MLTFFFVMSLMCFIPLNSGRNHKEDTVCFEEYEMILIFLTVVLICLLLFKLRKHKVLNQLPGPSWLEIFKLFFLTRSNKEVYSYLINLSNVYGTVVKLWLKPFRPVLLVSDPKYFESILMSKEHVHKTPMYDILATAGGNGLATAKDVIAWKSDRKALGVLFSNRTISQYSLDFKKHTDKLIAYFKLRENEPIDVQSGIARCTLDIILEYLCLEPSEENVEMKLIQALNDFLAIAMERTYSIYKGIDMLFYMTKSYKTWTESIEVIHKLVGDMLQKQVRLKQKTPQMTSRKRFVDLLLESGLSYDSVLSQLKNFITGGFETTSTTTCFALFELAKRPDIQEQIYKEYISIVEDNVTESLTFEGLQRMTYTEQVIKETLRMYPSAPFIQRRILTPITVGGLTIPGGVDVIFSIISLHKLHFKNPTKFDPERFSLENIQKTPLYAYAPFSLGPRDCIGRKIAMVEIKFILSTIIRNFTVHAVQPEHKLNVVGDIVTKSSNGIPVIFKKRNQS